MKFVRAVWKLLVGIKDALVLILMLLFFGMIYAGLSAKPVPVRAGVLDVDLNGGVVEQPSRAQWSDVAAGSRMQEYRLRDLIAAMQQAKEDSRVKAVALDLDSFTGGGQTAMGDLANAIRRGAFVGQAGHRVCDRLYQRELSACRGSVGSLAEPLGWCRRNRAGRLEPLLQGPARQARSDRERLSRRHLQVGGRAIHPQRHVSRGQAELLALDQAELETWRQSIHQARPKANVDLFLQNMNGAIAAAGGDMAKAARRRRSRRPHRRPRASSKLDWPSSAARQRANPPVTAASS